jgi:HSP20 family protein
MKLFAAFSLCLIVAQAASVKAADLHVSLTPDDRILNISGTRAESHGDREGRVRCHQLEIYFGPFERAVALPTGIRLDRDAIKATYREGFLSVRLPKKLQTDTPEICIIAISTELSTDEFREEKDTQ